MVETLLLILTNVLSFIIGYAIGKLLNYHSDNSRLTKSLLENIDGVTSVQLSPVRYVELMLAEDDLRELKLKLKDI